MDKTKVLEKVLMILVIFIIGFGFGTYLNGSYDVNINMDDNAVKAMESINYTTINQQDYVRYDLKDCIQGLDFFVCGKELRPKVYDSNGNELNASIKLVNLRK